MRKGQGSECNSGECRRKNLISHQLPAVATSTVELQRYTAIYEASGSLAFMDMVRTQLDYHEQAVSEGQTK